MRTAVQDAQDLLQYLTPAERAELDALLAQDTAIWRPLPGPQTMAWYSEADIVGYGGAAGGGKTDLGVGKALIEHQRSMVLRRVGTELLGITDRIETLLGNRDGYNGRDNAWRLTRADGRKVQIEFGAVPNLGDERKYQGRPHDLLWFDEAANFLESQVRFLMGWARSVDAAQRILVLMTFNPPTSGDGEWVIEFFAPWLDDTYPNPAEPGEIRWAAMVPQPNGASRDVWLDDGRPFVVGPDGGLIYDFSPEDYRADEIIRPLRRTFIGSRITDNPYLYGTGYMATLQALPEPLRSQMLRGDFGAGRQDSEWQVIPTAWVRAAQDRWRRLDRKGEMLSVGVDVARGGTDSTVIAKRHSDWWFDELSAHPGKSTPDGPTVAGLVIAELRDGAPVHIDVIGVGASPYDYLSSFTQTVGVNVSEKATAKDRSGRLAFRNLRSQLWWQMRELLDPANNHGVALPPDPRLRSDLTAPRWELQGSTIYVESREDIIDRIGRSPDYGTAVVLAAMQTPKRAVLAAAAQGHGRGYDPLERFQDQNNARSVSNPYGYDPLARLR